MERCFLYFLILFIPPSFIHSFNSPTLSYSSISLFSHLYLLQRRVSFPLLSYIPSFFLLPSIHLTLSPFLPVVNLFFHLYILPRLVSFPLLSYISSFFLLPSIHSTLPLFLPVHVRLFFHLCCLLCLVSFVFNFYFLIYFIYSSFTLYVFILFRIHSICIYCLLKCYAVYQYLHRHF